MAKEKAKMFEEIVFDDVQMAVDTFNECKRKFDKVESALKIAILATMCNILGMWIGSYIDIVALLMPVGWVCSIIAYVKGGGIGTALRWAWKLGVFGWIFFPFPVDIFIGCCTMMFAFMGFFLAPAIFVFMNYKQVEKDYIAARRYISYFKARAQQNQVVSNVSRTSKQMSQSTSYKNQNVSQTNVNRTSGNQGRVQNNTSATRSTYTSARNQSTVTRNYR